MLGSAEAWIVLNFETIGENTPHPLGCPLDCGTDLRFDGCLHLFKSSNYAHDYFNFHFTFHLFIVEFRLVL